MVFEPHVYVSVPVNTISELVVIKLSPGEQFWDFPICAFGICPRTAKCFAPPPPLLALVAL